MCRYIQGLVFLQWNIRTRMVKNGVVFYCNVMEQASRIKIEWK